MLNNYNVNYDIERFYIIINVIYYKITYLVISNSLLFSLTLALFNEFFIFIFCIFSQNLKDIFYIFLLQHRLLAFWTYDRFHSEDERIYEKVFLKAFLLKFIKNRKCRIKFILQRASSPPLGVY